MPLTPSDMENIFSYHPPTTGQLENYEAIRQAGKAFADAILANTPPSPDQSAAIRKVREAVMTANAAVALEGRY
jgi:hypothetical protein